jgi:hypothetical protein
MNEKKKASWGWIAACGVVIGLLSTGAACAMSWEPLVFLAVLFGAGTVAGAAAGRQGWLPGLIVGLPTALAQLTRRAGLEEGWDRLLAVPDFWRVALPSAPVVTGVAILGGMVGVWLRSRFDAFEAK